LHFIISWEISSESSNSEEINQALLQQISDYEWIRLLSNFYILDINSECDWVRVQQRFLLVSEKFPEVNFLLSPIYNCDSNFFVYRMPENGYHSSS